MHPKLTAAFLILTLASTALAEDYGIQGDDLAGRARIDREAGTYEIDFVRFNNKGKVADSQHHEGPLQVRGDDLSLGFTRTSTRVTGFTSWLRLDFTEEVEETTFTPFTASGEGAYVGSLEGHAVNLVPQGNTQDLIVLVVPGLSTNLWNQYGIPYLDENMATLAARGLNARRLAINTEQSVAVNADQIADEIRSEVAAGKRVLLIAHSKGGTDAVTALADPKNADLLPHVAGLVAIQPVFGGSRVADFVGDGTPISHIINKACGTTLNAKLLDSLQGAVDVVFRQVLPLVNKVDSTGSPDAVRDLRSRTRQGLLSRHPFPADRVPTVVLRGFMDGRSLVKPRHPLRGPLVVFQRYTKFEVGEDSDGMVSLGAQSIPGAVDEVTLENLDHFEPGFRGESPHKPVAITHLGLNLVLRYLKPAPQAPVKKTVNLTLGD